MSRNVLKSAKKLKLGFTAIVAVDGERISSAKHEGDAGNVFWLESLNPLSVRSKYSVLERLKEEAEL